MKNYYYCNADMHVYTEKEKSGAIYPAGRFEFIGAFKNRAAAEKAQYSAYLAGQKEFPCQLASRTIYTAAGCYRK